MIVYIYIGLAHFFGFKILNFKILWGFHKNEYFGGGGMKISCTFLGGHHKAGLVLGSFICIVWYFLKVKVQSCNSCWGLQ